MYAPSLFGQQICTGTMEVHDPSLFLLTMQRGILVLESYPNVYKYHISIPFASFSFFSYKPFPLASFSSHIAY